MSISGMCMSLWRAIFFISIDYNYMVSWGRHGRDRMIGGLRLRTLRTLITDNFVQSRIKSVL
jgi:hypothetical protein